MNDRVWIRFCKKHESSVMCPHVEPWTDDMPEHCFNIDIDDDRIEVYDCVIVDMVEVIDDRPLFVVDGNKWHPDYGILAARETGVLVELRVPE